MYTMHWTEGFRPTQLQRSRAAAAEHAVLSALGQSGRERRGTSLRRLARRRNSPSSPTNKPIHIAGPTLRDEGRTNVRPVLTPFAVSMGPHKSQGRSSR
jgi:hypothetical protein